KRLYHLNPPAIYDDINSIAKKCAARLQDGVIRVSFKVPRTVLGLMGNVYRRIFPAVDRELACWTKRAREIPNEELRKQALASIESKRFHCQGGGVYALLANFHWQKAVRFIVAYQTISDYLDNLCDRSTS